MKPQRFLWICLCVLGLSVSHQGDLSAQPYLGGEITWECTSQGNYRFIFKAYRDCHMVSFGSSSVLNTTVPGLPTINLSRIAIEEISPVCGCPGGGSISCSGPYVPGGQNGAVELHVYTSDAVYPNGVPLSGTPPQEGWLFYVQNCMRPIATNLNMNDCFAYLARMYANPNQPANTCFDNSPAFSESPSPVFCSGRNTFVNCHAIDPDGDSLAYEWAPLMASHTTPMPSGLYASGYSQSSPFPSTTHHPANIPAFLDPKSGMISLFSKTTGAFAHVVKVTSYRNGLKNGEIYREFYTIITPCDSINQSPSVLFNQTTFPAIPGVFTDSVIAGQYFQTYPSASDFQYCPSVSPPLAQSLHLQAHGAQFGSPINPAGCLIPPCATLTPSPTDTTPLIGYFGVQSTFGWQTGCQHLYANGADGTRHVTYDFIFKAYDNFCPVPAVRYAVLRLVVSPVGLVQSPAVNYLKVLSGGGVQIGWPAAVDTVGSFNSYHVWHAHSPNGPFTLIDSIFNINITSYTHQSAQADSVVGNYYVTTRSGCGGEVMSPVTDTMRTILLHVVNQPASGYSAGLVWNQPSEPLMPGGTAFYEIYRKQSGGTWNLMGTTTNNHWQDTTIFCQSLVGYRVELVDTAMAGSCRSVSNEVMANLVDQQPPAPGVMQLVTVMPGFHHNHLIWNPSPDNDVAGYVVYSELGSVTVPLDTVWGANVTNYTDLTLNPCSGSVSYRIKALDHCGNASGYSSAHQSIFLNVSKIPGINGFNLNWNPYLNMGVGVATAEILFGLNGAPEGLLATLSPLASAYQHTNLTWGDSCCYRIRVSDAQQVFQSYSCRVCQLMTTGIENPGFNGFFLGQNIPNPTGTSTRIPVVVPEAGEVELVILNPTGNSCMADIFPVVKGENHIILNTKNLAAGIYFYTVRFSGLKQTRKMVIQQ